MCDRPAPVSALCPRVEIPPVAVVVLALACLNKKKNNNINDQKEDEHSGVCELALAKLSVYVSDVFSHELSRKGLQWPREALN